MRTKNTLPNAQIDAFRSTLRGLQELPRRVRVLEALPIVDYLIGRGFPMAFLAQVLTDEGVPFKASSLKQAVYLWRKKEGVRNGAVMPSTGNEDPEQHSAMEGLSVASEPVAPAEAASDLSSSQISRESLTRARLQEIRDQHIDLEAIVRAGRKV